VSLRANSREKRVMAFETSHTDVEARFLNAALGEDARVLDAGCGRRSRLRAHRSRIAELVGIDLDSSAGSENDALDLFLVADLCARLPFDEGTFDLVYANFVVEHLRAPEVAFREWRRVLRPDGSLVVLTSNRANPLVSAAALLPHRARVALKRRGPRAAERDVIPAAYLANTPWRLSKLLEGAGFAAVSIAYVATLHRYAGDRALFAGALRALERVLPSRLRSTIVAWYRAA
jgi:SAM-dependent methyltransferase